LSGLLIVFVSCIDVPRGEATAKHNSSDVFFALGMWCARGPYKKWVVDGGRGKDWQAGKANAISSEEDNLWKEKRNVSKQNKKS
jgi:hypothetical protein